MSHSLKQTSSYCYPAESRNNMVKMYTTAIRTEEDIAKKLCLLIVDLKELCKLGNRANTDKNEH